MVYLGSKSEIAKKIGEQSQQDHCQDSVKISKPMASNSIEIKAHSQCIENHIQDSQDDSYKKKLMKLMVVVKLEQMGFDINRFRKVIQCEINLLDYSAIPQNSLAQQSLALLVSIIAIIERDPARIPSARRRNIVNFHFQQNLSQELQEPNVQIRAEEVLRRPPRQILCPICYLISPNFYQERCMHSFCEDCMRGYIRQNMSTGNYILKCPECNCPQMVQMESIKKLLQPRDYERFSYFKEKNEKEVNPNNKFCSRPDCGEVLILRQQKYQCEKCKYLYCETCMQPYHEGGSCDAALRNAIENTYNFLNIKKCPNCKSPIQKSEGCNHMKCKKCKHQFCWICLKKYNQHHFKYYNCFGCPGMQFQEEGQQILERMKQICLYINLPVILFLLLSCYVIFVPCYMMGYLAYKPIKWAQLDADKCECWIVRVLMGCLPDCMKYAFLWLLLQPRAILYALFISPFKITAMVCGEICNFFG